ncbi:hypothetical protein RLOC_00011980 [Lonchura striata]|uniref:Uncharacterized protein n=1 Tax=Lonchura striata TaxID=40157 RepID=A0A218VD45_9PASE|nr:hypothetical protein RLOC_00011980 [Lonchura striata domestica]
MYPHIPMITQVVSQPNPISSKPPADLNSPLLTVSLRQPKSMWFCGSRKGALLFSSAGCRDNRRASTWPRAHRAIMPSSITAARRSSDEHGDFSVNRSQSSWVTAGFISSFCTNSEICKRNAI